MKRSNTSELLIKVGEEKSTQGVRVKRVMATNEPRPTQFYKEGVFASIQPVQGRKEWFTDNPTGINVYDAEQARNDCLLNFFSLLPNTDCGPERSTLMRIENAQVIDRSITMLAVNSRAATMTVGER